MPMMKRPTRLGLETALYKTHLSIAVAVYDRHEETLQRDSTQTHERQRKHMWKDTEKLNASFK